MDPLCFHVRGWLWQGVEQPERRQTPDGHQVVDQGNRPLPLGCLEPFAAVALTYTRPAIATARSVASPACSAASNAAT